MNIHQLCWACGHNTTTLIRQKKTCVSTDRTDTNFKVFITNDNLGHPNNKVPCILEETCPNLEYMKIDIKKKTLSKSHL